MIKDFEVRDLRKKDKFVLDDLYLNGYARKCGVYATAVYISLCRHADKEQKCFPSIPTIAQEHGISSRQVLRSLSILEKYNIIRRERLGKKANNRYYLLDKSEWTDSHITPTPSDTTDSHITRDSQSHHPMTDSHIHSKETHIKETHSKEAEQSSAGAVVNLLIAKFEQVNPSYQRFFANKTQRAALERLLARHGPEKLGKIIELLPKTNQAQYAPTITTPLQLEDKIASLVAFLTREKIKDDNEPTIYKIK